MGIARSKDVLEKYKKALDLDAVLKNSLVELFKRGEYSNLLLNPKQAEAFSLIFSQNPVKTLLYGGAAGGGKSFLGSAALALPCLAFPGVRFFAGRKVLKQAKQTIFQSFRKVCDLYGIKKDIDYKWQSVEGRIQFKNGSEIQLLQLKKEPSDPLFEDLGSQEFTGGWIEEGGEIPFEAYDTLLSRTGRHLNDKYNIKPFVLITCNPKRNWLYEYFYKPFIKDKLPESKAFIEAKYQDNPKNESGYLDMLLGINDKTRRERLIEANWEYINDPYMLCDPESIENVFYNDHVKAGNEHYLSADIAMHGSDLFIIGVFKGWRLIELLSIEKSDSNEIEKTLRSLKHKYRIREDNMVYDSDGIGGFLRAKFPRAYNFVNNSAPLKPPHSNKKTKPENYQNLKSQMGFKLADIINESDLFIDIDLDEKTKEAIKSDLYVLKNGNPASDGKLKIESKDKIKGILGRSPDYLDMLLMRCIFEFKRRTSRPRGL